MKWRSTDDEGEDSPLASALIRVCGGSKTPTDRTLYLSEAIDATVGTALSVAIRGLWHTPGEIFLMLNSEGGDVFGAFGIYDLIRASAKNKAPVTGIVNGAAMSAAAFVLQGCKSRQITANSYLMIHQLWNTSTFANMSQYQRESALMRDMQDRYNAGIARRSRVTKRQVMEHIEGGDWWLSATEAYAFGLVDEVV